MISYTGPTDNVVAAYSYKGIVYDVTTTIDAATVTGLKIKAEIYYYTGGAWVKIGTKRQEPYLGLLSGGSPVYRFNIDGYIQSVLTYDLNKFTPDSTIYRATNSIRAFKVRFTEEHRDDAGIIQEYASTETAVKYAINAARQIYEEQEIEADYAMYTDGIYRPFLTDRKRPIYQRPGEVTHLSLLHKYFSGLVCRIQMFSDPSTVTTNSIPLNYIPSGSNIDYIRAVVSLNDIFTEANTRALIWISRQLPGGGFTRVSEEVWIYPDRRQFASEVRMHWLNSYGGFDDYTFTASRSAKGKTKREEFKKQPTNSPKSRGYTTLNITSNDEITVFSQFESNDVIKNINGIFDSPEVYMYENGEYIPVNVEGSGVEYEETNTIKQIKLTYTRAVEKMIQNG